MSDGLTRRIATDLGVREAQVAAAVRLLDDGATVPFIARYRKEATAGLDDTQLRQLEERLRYLRELDARRDTVLRSIEAQGKLDEPLRKAILEADSKTRLEDLYLPYKPKRRTKAQTAREAGLAPLAEALLADPGTAPDILAATYVDPERGIDDTRAALDGARQILVEHFAEDAELTGALRDRLWRRGVLESRVVGGREQDGRKFADYFEFREAIARIPSHRALALLRGRHEQILDLRLVPDDPAGCEGQIAARFGIQDRGRPGDAWLRETVRWCWRVKLSTRLELELMQRLREQAEAEAIRVFARNLQDLLLAAPAGPRPTLGLDPGLRTGVKVAVIDATGRVLETATIHPHAPQKRWDEALATLTELARRHRVELVAIGNGTASRETERLVQALIRRQPELQLQKVLVSEAGASVYSASELAASELATLDVSLRGAVSIARRLQDPLAELVKIDPKAIGVGQYQHDVAQNALARALDAVVEDCVNAVGVDANTASPALLARVAGLSPGLARQLVEYRDTRGPFRDRQELLQVPRLGPRTFEQAAGFLRIQGGRNPLDRSAVHPEAYPVVERILAACGKPVEQVLGNAALLRGLDAERFSDTRFGLPTVHDILAELEKPGRDPRPAFRTARFRDDVETLADLEPGMVLEGVVSNVTNFGAFVDVGVHQDGLVHVSALAERYVRDPREVVRAGDVVRVKVLEVDPERRRIALSMRLQDAAAPDTAPEPASARTSRPRSRSETRRPSRPQAPPGALAEAFKRARKPRH